MQHAMSPVFVHVSQIIHGKCVEPICSGISVASWGTLSFPSGAALMTFGILADATRGSCSDHIDLPESPRAIMEDFTDKS